MTHARAQVRPEARTAAPSRPAPEPAVPPPATRLGPSPQPASSPVACTCGGTCPRCTPPRSVLAEADFSGVRLHPHAPDVTQPRRARAVTVGQNIYFHPGEYRPGTPRGDALLQHELAHTLQAKRTRPEPTGGEPTAGTDQKVPDGPGEDSLEENATALAEGDTRHVQSAPAGAALCSPFDDETPTQRARRHTLIQSIGNAQATLLDLLRSRGLIAGEEAAAERNGVRGVVIPANAAGTGRETFLSYAERDTRIRRIIRFLQALATRYRSAPVPADFAAPGRTRTRPPLYSSEVTYETPQGGVSESFVGPRPEWPDLQAAYRRYLVEQGLFGDDYEWDWYYLDPSARVTPGAARGAPRLGGGIQTGTFMVVPDIEREPLRYWRLTGTSPAPEGSEIVELWHDAFGYYYLHRGQRIDVPSPWK